MTLTASQRVLVCKLQLRACGQPLCYSDHVSNLQVQPPTDLYTCTQSTSTRPKQFTYCRWPLSALPRPRIPTGQRRYCPCAHPPRRVRRSAPRPAARATRQAPVRPGCNCADTGLERQASRGEQRTCWSRVRGAARHTPWQTPMPPTDARSPGGWNRRGQAPRTAGPSGWAQCPLRPCAA